MSRHSTPTSPGSTISGWKIKEKLTRLEATEWSAPLAQETLKGMALELSDFGKATVGIINLKIGSTKNGAYCATGVAVLLTKK